VSRLAEAFGERPGAGFRTTFEYLTGLALLTFQEEEVERAVVEVGLGGRLDATNVLPPGPAVLTPVSRDHTRVLGRTLQEIAADKVHILKRGGTAYVMPQRADVCRVVEERLRRVRTPGVRTADAVEARLTKADLEGADFHVVGKRDYGVVRTRLWGAHQADNVAAAVAVAEALLGEASPRGVRKGLEGASLPGRLERFQVGGIDVVLDGGHNPAAARAVARAVALHAPGRRVTAVVGMARDKEHRAFLRALSPVVSTWVFTAAGNPRAEAPERLAARWEPPADVVGEPVGALARALGGGPDVVLVAGSFVLAGEVREALREG